MPYVTPDKPLEKPKKRRRISMSISEKPAPSEDPLQGKFFLISVITV
jgi:hypothetical protein